MAKSFTKQNKTSKQKAQTSDTLKRVYTAIDFAVKYVNSWTKNCYNHLAVQSPIIVHSTSETLQQHLPICWAASDTKYYVGVDSIVKGVHGWQRKLPNEEKSLPFSSLKTAFSYTVLVQQQKHSRAQKLLQLDNEYSRLLSSVEHYLHTLRTSKSSVKRTIAQTRLESTQIKLSYIKERLKSYYII